MWYDSTRDSEGAVPSGVTAMRRIDSETLRTMLYKNELALSKRDLYKMGRSLRVHVTKGMRWDELFDRVYDGSERLKLIGAFLIEARSRLRTCPDASKHTLTSVISSLEEHKKELKAEGGSGDLKKS